MTHLAKLSHPYREEVREELSSEEAAVIHRYFWGAQQPLGDKGDPSTCQQDTDSSTTAWKAGHKCPGSAGLAWLAFILLQKPLTTSASFRVCAI